MLSFAIFIIKWLLYLQVQGIEGRCKAATETADRKLELYQNHKETHSERTQAAPDPEAVKQAKQLGILVFICHDYLPCGD